MICKWKIKVSRLEYYWLINPHFLDLESCLNGFITFQKKKKNTYTGQNIINMDPLLVVTKTGNDHKQAQTTSKRPQTTTSHQETTN